MINKKIYSLIFVVTFLLFITSVNASIENIGTVKQNDCITLPQTCNCTWNNITTIMFPDKTFITVNQPMSKDGTYFNFTFCNTSALGMYIVNGVGDIDGQFNPFNYIFETTTTGNNNNNTVPLFLGLGGFILLIFAFVLRNNYLGFMSGVLFIILGIYTIIYGLGFVSDLYTQAISYVSIGLGLFIFLASAYAAINDTGITLLGKRDDGDDDF